MPLIVSKNDTFNIVVRYTENEKGLTFYDKAMAPADAKEDTFTFRRPNWANRRAIMANCLVVSGPSLVVNPFSLLDARIKILLKEWTLKDEDGKPVKVSIENIDALDYELLTYLNERLDEIDSKTQETIINQVAAAESVQAETVSAAVAPAVEVPSVEPPPQISNKG